MVGEEDPAGSRGPCPLPSGRKTFWRSASWSSRTPSSEKDCCDTTESNAGQFRRFPVPLTPRSQHNSKARACLPPLQPLSITRRNLDEWPKAGSDDVGEWPHPPTPSGNSNKGLKLDLSSFQQNLDPTGTLVNKDRIACFDKECSKVAEHIYLGGDAVARDREILRQHGITHVLNCVGFVCPEYFKADLVYKTLWLQDSPSEDITSILYDVFDYFEDVREQGGRVLVHCCQGVSRSTSLVIAYLMWREGQSFEDAFQYVKAARGITNPNMGFACQLLQCQKRVHAIPLSPSSVLRMYRMAPHSPYDPLHLVPKMLNDPSPSALDSRGAFIIHVPSAIYVWVGKNCESVMERDAKSAAFQVVRYERVQGPIITVEEGEEPMDFWDTFSSIPISVDSSDNSVLVKEQISSTVSVGVGRKKVDLYDADFEFFHKALTGGIVPPFSSSTGTEHETRVPARESNWSVLRRKFVSGSVKDWISASKAALCRVYSDSLLMVDTNTQVNKIPLFSPATVYSNSSVNSKSTLESLSPSTAPPSLTLSPVSSVPTDSLSKFPLPAPVSQEPPDGGLSSQPCSKSGPSPSKGHTLSLAERRGNLSPSLKLSTFRGASSSGPSPLDSQESNTTSFEINEHGLSYPPKQNLKAESALIKTGEVKGKYWVQEGQELSMLDGLIDSGLEVSKSVHPLIYSWPDLEKIVKFGEGDLDSKAVFLFLVPGTDTSRHKGGKLYLWIGSCFEHQNRLNQVNGNKESIEDKNIDWNCVGSDFLSLMGLPKDIPIKEAATEVILWQFKHWPTWMYSVSSPIHQLSFSPHTDAKGIMDLVRFLSPQNVILVHGEKPKMATLKGRIQSELGIKCYDPANNETIHIPSTKAVKVDVTKAFILNNLNKFSKRANISLEDDSGLCVQDSEFSSSLQISDERVAEGVLIMEKTKRAKLVHHDELLSVLGEKEHKVELFYCFPIFTRSPSTVSQELDQSGNGSFLHTLFLKLSTEDGFMSIMEFADHLEVGSLQLRICPREYCPHRIQGSDEKNFTMFLCCNWSWVDEKLARRAFTIIKDWNLCSS